MPTLASQHATATPAVATQPTVSQPAVWIDNDAFPHIIRGIMSYAAMPELKAFRRVSRQCCAVVDAMLGYHLLLDGDFYEDFPRRSAVAALHNDVWAMVGDHRVYHMWTTETQIPFGADGEDTDESHSTPVPLPQFPARVLDIHGTLRRTVVDGLTARMPNLHTVRVHYVALGSDGYSRDTQWTGIWEQLGEEEEAEDDAAREKREGVLPAPASVTRLVVFTSLVPEHVGTASFPMVYPPHVEELVVHIAYNSTPGVVCVFGECARPPPSLDRMTVIFTPADAVPGEYHQDDDQAEALKAFTETFPESVTRISVPTTIIGMDALASAPAFGKMAYDQLVAALRPASEPITFVPLDEYRASLDDDTWELYTRQKLVNPAMVKHREMRWSDGTAVIGRVDASQPWVPSRYPESEEEVEEVEKPRSRKQRMKKLAKRLIGRA